MTAPCWPELALLIVMAVSPSVARAVWSLTRPATGVLATAERLVVLGTGLLTLIVGRSAMAEAARSTPDNRVAAGRDNTKSIDVRDNTKKWEATNHSSVTTTDSVAGERPLTLVTIQVG